MLDKETLFADLNEIGLSSWCEPLEPILDARTADGVHGDLAGWLEVIRALPGRDVGDIDSAHVRGLLLQLAPWRKGPFSVRGVEVDSEWRSDMKWNRLRDEISPLTGRKVLDVGCGNGYYALCMLGAGATHVIGIDPSLLFVCQFLAIQKLSATRSAHVLPLRLDDLPTGSCAFDTTFSMGVLYHRRDPAAHLRELRDTLQPGGELVLETLVLPGDDNAVLEPDSRYARMRNVWHVPAVPVLKSWLREAGFGELRLIDVTRTTTDEQRSTDWMPFESLAEALDPKDPQLTTEGLPAPTRAIISGIKY